MKFNIGDSVKISNAYGTKYWRGFKGKIDTIQYERDEYFYYCSLKRFPWSGPNFIFTENELESDDQQLDLFL